MSPQKQSCAGGAASSGRNRCLNAAAVNTGNLPFFLGKRAPQCNTARLGLPVRPLDAALVSCRNWRSTPPLPLSPTFPDPGERYTVGKASGSAAPLVSAVGQTYLFHATELRREHGGHGVVRPDHRSGRAFAIEGGKSHDRGKNDDGLRLARIRPGRDGARHGLPGVGGLRPGSARAQGLSRPHRPGLCRRCVHARRGRSRRVASDCGVGRRGAHRLLRAHCRHPDERRVVLALTPSSAPTAAPPSSSRSRRAG
jgi:hypothetical protein